MLLFMLLVIALLIASQLDYYDEVDPVLCLLAFPLFVLLYLLITVYGWFVPLWRAPRFHYNEPPRQRRRYG